MDQIEVMGVSGWIQVLSIIGALIVILGFYGASVAASVKAKSAADKANGRIDDLEDKDIKDHEERLRKIEDAKIKEAERFNTIEINLININNNLQKVMKKLDVDEEI